MSLHRVSSHRALELQLPGGKQEEVEKACVKIQGYENNGVLGNLQVAAWREQDGVLDYLKVARCGNGRNCFSRADDTKSWENIGLWMQT